MPTIDVDQGGTGFQTAKIWLGPTLGWVMQQVRPTQLITTGGTTILPAGTSVVFVNALATVSIILPSVGLWMQEPVYQPNTGFERAIWIKDYGGHAAAFNITVDPFATEKIDNSSSNVILNINFQSLRLYPLNDLSGWFVG